MLGLQWNNRVTVGAPDSEFGSAKVWSVENEYVGDLESLFQGDSNAQPWERRFTNSPDSVQSVTDENSTSFDSAFTFTNAPEDSLSTTFENDELFDEFFESFAWLTEEQKPMHQPLTVDCSGAGQYSAVSSPALHGLKVCGFEQQTVLAGMGGGQPSPPTTVVPFDALFGAQADQADDLLENLDHDQATALLQDFNSCVAGITPPLSPENVEELTENYDSDNSNHQCDFLDRLLASSPALSVASSSLSSFYEDLTPAPSPQPPKRAAKRQRAVETPKPAKKKRGADVDTKKSRKRNQNKTAATRYRVKKRSQAEQLSLDLEGLEVKNKQLKTKAEQLTSEIAYLKGLMKEVLIAKGVIKA